MLGNRHKIILNENGRLEISSKECYFWNIAIFIQILLPMGNINCQGCHHHFNSLQGQGTTITLTNDLQKAIQQFRLKNKPHQYRKQLLQSIPFQQVQKGYVELTKGQCVFMGHFVSGSPNGEGILIKNEKEYYNGNFDKGKQSGTGYYKNQSIQFKGTFVDGKFEKGELKSPSYTYKGNFKNNKFEGLGDIVYSNGESYSGPFKAGKFHGNGVYVAKNGKYVGNFRLGKYHGLGFYEWKDGSTYEGEYHEGSREGLGRFIRGDFSYEGIWKNGKPEKSENIALAEDTKSQIPLTL